MNPADYLTETQRFWSKVDRTGDGCWPWTGETNNQGYGRFEFWHDGKRSRVFAHRLSLLIAGVPLADGIRVRHSCDNPPCVRPDHLLVGSQRLNVHDMIARGRANWSGLTSDTLHHCRACGAMFYGTPNRRYCDEHRPRVRTGAA